MAEAPLHMVRLSLEQQRLFHLGKRTRLPPLQQDAGYLVHCALKELFGDLAPKPFAITGEQGRYLPVLGYVRADKAKLKEQAQLQASPDIHEACDWETFAAKEMPSSWSPGQRLRFTVRACPVKRKNSAGLHHKAGAEVDVFLDRCWQVGREVEVNREEVYLSWLGDRLGEAGARLLESKVSKFQRLRLLRRDHAEERTSARVERPDVTFEGALEVAEPSQFAALLARGIGRHRAFGFGMLLVRPG